jgi:hypothetical protein
MLNRNALLLASLGGLRRREAEIARTETRRRRREPGAAA